MQTTTGGFGKDPGRPSLPSKCPSVPDSARFCRMKWQSSGKVVGTAPGSKPDQSKVRNHNRDGHAIWEKLRKRERLLKLGLPLAPLGISRSASGLNATAGSKPRRVGKTAG